MGAPVLVAPVVPTPLNKSLDFSTNEVPTVIASIYPPAIMPNNRVQLHFLRPQNNSYYILPATCSNLRMA